MHICGFHYRGIELLKIEKIDLPNMHKIVPELEKTQAWSGSPFKYSYSWKKSRTWVNSVFRQGFGILLVKQNYVLKYTYVHIYTYVTIYNCVLTISFFVSYIHI